MGEKLPVGCMRPRVIRILVESTIFLLIFSLFLEISNVVNYLIFVGVWYILVLAIVGWFKSQMYCIDGDIITVSTLLSKRRIRVNEARDIFVSQGPIAKRLKCGSIYFIMKDGKAIVLYDISDPEGLLRVIKGS